MRVFNPETMMSVEAVRGILRTIKYAYRRLRLIDVSGSGAGCDYHGYDYRLVVQQKPTPQSEWDEVEVIATSHDTSYPDAVNRGGGIGACGPTFDIAEIMPHISKSLAASAAGSVRSPAKTLANRENAKQPRPNAQGKKKPRKPKTE